MVSPPLHTVLDGYKINTAIWFIKKYGSMDLLLELLLVLLLELLLYVPYHVDTREPSCNARNKLKLQEWNTSRKHLYGTFE